MSPDPLPHNLSYLCSLHPSIAEVCRRLGINRQQFNRYLSGQARPSRRSMRRICDFFGVEETELLIDHARFVEIAGLRRSPLADPAAAAPFAHFEQLLQRSGDLRRYVGFYFRYSYSFGYAGRIVKCLVAVYEKDGKFFWKSIERLRPAENKYVLKVSKYAGSMLLLGDRIFVLECETLMRNSLTVVILYPSYHTRISHLVGIHTGAPLRRGRKPSASIVLLEFLGRSIDVRKAIASCGLFEETDPAIDPTIRSTITNRIPEGSFVLEIDEL